MAKKIDLKKNLKGANNIANFSNDKINEKKKKKTIIIWANEEIVNSFIELAFNFYKVNNQLALYSWSHFFPIALKNVRLYFEEKYSKIDIPNEDYLTFYKKKSKSNNADEIYDLSNLQRINFFVDADYVEEYYCLLHTFYINERTDLTSFSVSLFFYDFVSILKNDINLVNYEKA